MDSFKFFDINLPYLSQGEAHIGERRIEIPIAGRWMSFMHLREFIEMVEVGAVLPSWNGWRNAWHTVVDPYDPYPYAIREDAENYDYTGKNVLSISTIEHIGMADYGNTDIDENKAARVLEKIMKEAEHYLITIPTGYNKTLDECIISIVRTKKMKGELFCFKQINANNKWEQVETANFNTQYNSPFPFANQVLFLTDNLDWAK